MKPPHPPHPDEAPDSPNAPDLSATSDDKGLCLSALMDGQAWAAPEATRQWRDDEQARKNWHAFHLIGDVLRSEELARPAAHDRQFLHALNKRLAHEPVVLAPPASGPLAAVQGAAQVAAAATAGLAAVAELPQVRPAVARRRWLMPAAALAGVAGVAGMAVMAGVLVMARPGVNGPAAVPVLAAASGAGLTVVSMPGTGNAAALATPAGPDGVIRDPRLEEFLRAHQAARSGVAAGVPGSALRSVGAVMPVAAGQ